MACHREKEYAFIRRKENFRIKNEVKTMILADKIIELRKKAGYSQEELAEKMGVSRQSVSKWEGALSIPDLDKIDPTVKSSLEFVPVSDFCSVIETAIVLPEKEENKKADSVHKELPKINKRNIATM